ncbi:NAD kinase [Fodinicola acaciae]|uniref:NAD kinase n=1 Tax=Fodinicola acaciae TaxID=2681555 RepID=UPI0013D83577|nr:NAD kinase [Fodinicola acaciae]
MTRQALLVAHTGRPENLVCAKQVVGQLVDAGFEVRVLTDEAGELHVKADEVDYGPQAAGDSEIVFALGGDGTLLRAAELARPGGVPLLGVNLGHVGFLAEAELHDLDDAVSAVVAGRYNVDERLTIDVTVVRGGEVVVDDWALNEASVEKAERERMLDVLVSVDRHPLSRWGCDGVVLATPTGSTAYAFSAGGPVVSPDVEALLLAPISAHALFNRPLVAAPTSVLTVDVLPNSRGVAILCCDGRRSFELRTGDRVEVRRSATPVRVVRLEQRSFTERLVAKFALPIDGWRRPD